MSVRLNTSLELFREMLRIRMVEETIADRYPEQEMRCPVHLSIGQEAIAVGVCKAVLHTDYLISNHRAHAHYLAKGGNLKSMIAEIYGKETGCSLGRGGSMHLIDRSVGMYGSTPIVGGSVPVGVGLAFATWMRGEKQLTLIFIGEGATEEGVFAECLNFVALKKLPVLFICENNFYSVYSPLDVRQPKERDRVAIAKAHGFYTDGGNGNDVDEVYQKSQLAVAHIRSGSGPAYLEFVTYRHREHCGPYFDNNIGYRTEDEYLEWKKKDPIETHQKRLQLDERELKTIRTEIHSEIEEAFAFAKNSPFPKFNIELENPYAQVKST
jgi:pyruvate dehydrogenase E1 component alpha subunit